MRIRGAAGAENRSRGKGRRGRSRGSRIRTESHVCVASSSTYSLHLILLTLTLLPPPLRWPVPHWGRRRRRTCSRNAFSTGSVRPSLCPLGVSTGCVRIDGERRNKLARIHCGQEVGCEEKTKTPGNLSNKIKAIFFNRTLKTKSRTTVRYRHFVIISLKTNSCSQVFSPSK